MQLDLFGLAETAPVELHTVQMAPLMPGYEWWLSDDVAERRAGVLRSADFWQRTHDMTGWAYASQESIYAANLRTMAVDMDARPEFYRAKPAHVSDFQWWAKGGKA